MPTCTEQRWGFTGSPRVTHFCILSLISCSLERNKLLGRVGCWVRHNIRVRVECRVRHKIRIRVECRVRHKVRIRVECRVRHNIRVRVRHKIRVRARHKIRVRVRRLAFYIEQRWGASGGEAHGLSLISAFCHSFLVSLKTTCRDHQTGICRENQGGIFANGAGGGERGENRYDSASFRLL